MTRSLKTTGGRSFQPPSARFSWRKSSIGSNPETAPAVVVVLGPTAVGKTDFLLEVLGPGVDGRRFEIISADSMQVYRGLDIGTAKPDRGLRESLPHHLIDVAEPDRQFSAGEFVRQADHLVREIAARGRAPAVSGGTAYYLRNFIFGLPATPAADPAERLKLQEELRERGADALYRELEEVDPASASRIPANDLYRVIRALEVARSTGKPLSSFEVPREPRRKHRLLLIGLQRDRQELYRRIEQRVEWMFGHGLVEEVAGLFERGCRESDPGLQGIGYREFAGLRRGCLTLADIRELIQRDTRRYAKRQITFFRSLPGVQWVHPAETGRAREWIRRFLDEGDDSP